MEPNQCRAARALLGWTQEALASRASVSIGALRNYERGSSELMAANKSELRRTFEAAGIVFGDAAGLLSVGIKQRGRRK